MQHHLSISNELLDTFRENDVLHTEAMNPDHESGATGDYGPEATGGRKPATIDGHEAFKKLSKKIKEIEECRAAISNLGKDTKEMIDLVSIFS